MKKYMICLFLFAAVSAFCLGVGIGTRQSCKKNLLQETSQSESSSFQETEMADYEAANGRQVERATYLARGARSYLREQMP